MVDLLGSRKRFRGRFDRLIHKAERPQSQRQQRQ
jgi:hypothetical protein